MKERMTETQGDTKTIPPAGVEGEPKMVISPETLPPRRGGILGWFSRGERPQVLVRPGEGIPQAVQTPPERSQPAESVTQEVPPPQAETPPPPQPPEAPPGGNGGGPEGPKRPEGESPEKDPKAPARKIVRRLVEIDTMSAAEREERAGEYVAKCAELTVYANADKVFKEEPASTEVKKGLEDFDQQEINRDPNRSQAEKNQLRQYLDRLDEISQQLTEAENTLKIQTQAEALFTPEQWAKLAERKEKLSAARGLLEAEIRRLTRPNFLEDRQEKQQEIEKEVSKRQQALKSLKEQEERELLGQPEGWEKRLEGLEDEGLDYASLEKFLADEEKLRQSGDPNFWQYGYQRAKEVLQNTYTFSQALELLETQQRYRREKSPDFNREEYIRAKEIVGWFFYEAGRLGMLHDLDQDLGFELQQCMESLGLRPIQEEHYRQTATLSGVRELIKKRGEGKLEAMNSVSDEWEDVRETGSFTLEQEGRFKGIRAEYVGRAHEQMLASLTNLVHFQDRLRLQSQLIREEIDEDEYRRRIARIPKNLYREQVYEEWGFGFEARERRRMEKETLAEQSKPLFKESYFHIELLGKDRRDIEQGAEQAAEHIIRSAGTYSLDAVRQRRELLMKAIDETTPVLQAEVGSEKKAKELVQQIQWRVLNKLDFYILDWLANNLRMDEYSNYFEQTVMMKGIDRLKAISTMSNGLVGLALWYLYKPEYRLFFRPGGFKNQLNQSGAQSYLRDRLKEQLVELLMRFELGDQGQGREGKVKTLDGLINSLTTEQFIQNFRENKTSNPKQRLEEKRQKVDTLSKQYKDSKNPADLEALREARRVLAFEQNRFQRAKAMTENALDEAIRVMNIFGEASRLGAPSIITDKKKIIDVNGKEIEVSGDHISIEDAVLFYKFATLQAAKAYGKTHGAEDNQSLIRWRSTTWRKRWKEAGLDRGKASRDFPAGGKDGNKLPVKLAEGWEETGLTFEEWQGFVSAVAELRKNGYQAKLKELVRREDGSYEEREATFEDIIKRPELQPVLSNFIADYKSSNNQLNDPYLRSQAARGRMESIKNILARLGLKEPVEGNTQQVLNKYTELVESSRQFHAELTRLAYYAATHRSLQKERKQSESRTIYMDSAFDEGRLDYGFQGLPWGIKRAQYRKVFEYTNLRRTTQRGLDLVHAIPISLASLPQESGSDDLLSMLWELKRLEKDDEWTLMTFAMRSRDAWFIGSRLEGDIDLKEGKGWGFFEKLLTNANSLWKVIAGIVGGATPRQAIERLVHIGQEITEENKERIEEYFRETTLNRLTPIIIGAEKQLGPDRQALGSGAGYEENEKFALRFLEWLMSEKPPTEEHGAREAGGMEGYKEIADIIRFLTKPGSYIRAYMTREGKKVELYREPNRDVYRVPGEERVYKKEDLVLDLEESSSFWDEVWRKITPSHNPRIPNKAPEPT